MPFSRIEYRNLAGLPPYPHRVLEEAAACPIRSRLYGGMPSGGGYGTGSEYEVGAQRMAEALHCILGSLGRNTGNDSNDWDRMRAVEAGHILEERGIVVKVLKEYARPLYIERLREGYQEKGRYGVQSVDSMAKNSPVLEHTATAAFNALYRAKEGMPEDVYRVAAFSYLALVRLAQAVGKSVEAVKDEQDTRGAFTDPSLRSVVRKLDKAVSTLL